MLYPWFCESCEEGFYEEFLMSEVPVRTGCPSCGQPCEQDYCKKRVRGYVSRQGNWSGGKRVAQLNRHDPLAMVTNEKQALEAYKERGLDPETLQVVDQKKYDRGLAIAAKEKRKKGLKPKHVKT